MVDPEPYPFNQLLSPEVQAFIHDNQSADTRELLLRSKTILGMPTVRIMEQILGHRKAKEKLPLLSKTDSIIYPPAINLEQCSSEATAIYKKEILKSLFSNPPGVADLTGGFGVDTFFLSRHAQSVDMVEPDGTLLSIANHNHKTLGASNIIGHQQTAEQFLEQTKKKFDLVYIDPSRRKDGKKMISLSSCEPNVLSLLDKLIKTGSYCLIKASPLLDISKGISELQHVVSVFVLSVDDECRELLFLISKNEKINKGIIAVGLNKAGKVNFTFSFHPEDEKKIESSFSPPLQYLYEPDVSILKAGAFKSIANKFNLKKLSVNTHLYTTDSLHDNFYGRVFQVRETVKLDKKVKELFPGASANIISRNHPLSVDQIRKKTGLKEGGDLYLICARYQNNTVAVIAERKK